MREIQLTQGKFAMVDDEDYEKLNKFNYCYNKGYAARGRTIGKNKRDTITMHKDIIFCPEGMEIDHINGNKLDNRKSNLRICTKQQNQWNCSSTKNSTSKYRGVCFDNGTGKWRAGIMKDGKFIHIGRFFSETEAAIAWNEKAIEICGEYARLNEV